MKIIDKECFIKNVLYDEWLVFLSVSLRDVGSRLFSTVSSSVESIVRYVLYNEWLVWSGPARCRFAFLSFSVGKSCLLICGCRLFLWSI